MKLPDPPPDLSSEAVIGWKAGIKAGYRLGLRDGNPGRKKTAAKTEAARANGAKGGRPHKIP